jgi:hypothetical protein
MRESLEDRTARTHGVSKLVRVAVGGLAVLAVAPAALARPDRPAPAHAAPAHAAPGPPAGPPAPQPVDTSACTNPTLSQPFQWARDSHWYTLVPGQSPGSFAGTGWSLSGGAHVATAQLRDGSIGTVLDLPSGARAVTPAICVTSSDPAARAMVRNVVGGQGIGFYISYAGRRTWLKPQKTGQFHGRHGVWTPSTRINLIPRHQSGWQVARFIFVGGGKRSDFQVYDFYVDPRMKS